MSERRVALVTGAGRGIGAATARALAADGCAVSALDICSDIDGLGYALATRDQLDDVVASCGPDAMSVVADVRRSDQLESAVASTVERFGGIDVVVAAAGVMSGGAPTWLTTDEGWDLSIDVNLTAVWRTARVAVPSLLARPQPRTGRFIAIASAAGMGGHRDLSAYCAAKHGVVGLVRSLAADLGRSGITANAVCPGSTETGILDATKDVYGLESIEEFAVHQPIGRILAPEEVARAVVWLASPAAGGVTGSMVAVDGGMTI